METKICTKCGKELPATTKYFRLKKNRGKVGLSKQCLECEKEYRVKRYKENQEKFVEYSREYRKIHYQYAPKPKDGHKFCMGCGEEFPATTDYFRIKNKDGKFGLTGQCKKCLCEIDKMYYRDNKKELTEKNKIWKNNNKEKVRSISIMAQQKRKAQAAKIEFNFSGDEWNQTKKRFNNECVYCGKQTKLTQDHFWPLSRGGGYTKFNIIPSCQSCNSSKHNKPFEEWYPTHESYSPEREAKIYQYFEQLALENGGWGRQRYDLGIVTIEVINEDL